MNTLKWLQRVNIGTNHLVVKLEWKVSWGYLVQIWWRIARLQWRCGRRKLTSRPGAHSLPRLTRVPNICRDLFLTWWPGKNTTSSRKKNSETWVKRTSNKGGKQHKLSHAKDQKNYWRIQVGRTYQELKSQTGFTNKLSILIERRKTPLRRQFKKRKRRGSHK